MAELGLIGFTLFVALQLLVMIQLVPRLRRRESPGPSCMAASAALAVFVCFNVLGALDNPGHFFDIQLPIWGLIGTALPSPVGATSHHASGAL